MNSSELNSSLTGIYNQIWRICVDLDQPIEPNNSNQELANLLPPLFDSLASLDSSVRSPDFADIQIPLSALELLDSGLSLSLPLKKAIFQASEKNDVIRGKIFAAAALRDLLTEKSAKFESNEELKKG